MTARNEVLQLVRQWQLPAGDLIALYDGGLSTLVSGEAANPLFVRIFGVRPSALSVAAAIDAVVKDAEEPARSELLQQWHDVKVRHIDEGPDELRSAAIASLQAYDYEDPAVVAALLETLSSGDRQRAIEFIQSAAEALETPQRDQVVEAVVETLEETVRREATDRAVALLIHAVHEIESRAGAVPAESITRRVAATAERAGVDFPLVEFCAYAVREGGADGPLREWLGSAEIAYLALALSVLADIGIAALDPLLRDQVCATFPEVRGRIAAMTTLSASAVAWLTDTVTSLSNDCLIASGGAARKS